MKITRRTQLLVVALALCFTTMIGSTFAWFTESVQTKENNVITAGNLDIDVQYTLGKKDAQGNYIWKPLDGAEGLLLNTLWEPGHTEVIAVKVENKGTVSAKYTGSLNIVSEKSGKTKADKEGNVADIKLSDHLKLSLITCAETMLDYAYAGYPIYTSRDIPLLDSNVLTVGVLNDDQEPADPELGPGASNVTIIKVAMPTTVGNEANHNGTDIPSIKLGLNIVATQTVDNTANSKEFDTFGHDYDANAQYPTLTSTDDENEATE